VALQYKESECDIRCFLHDIKNLRLKSSIFSKHSTYKSLEYDVEYIHFIMSCSLGYVILTEMITKSTIFYYLLHGLSW
jgi:hypothetical protein